MKRRWIALALAIGASLAMAGACVRQVVLDPDAGNPDALPLSGPDASFPLDGPSFGDGPVPDASIDAS